MERRMHRRKLVLLNGARMASREEAGAYLVRKLGLPADHAKNLDALYDALTERAKPTRLMLINRNKLLIAQPDYGKRLIAMLADAASGNACLTFEARGGVFRTDER